MSKEKIYINAVGFRQGKYGLKMGGNLNRFIEELRKLPLDDNGNFNVQICQLRNPIPGGATHYMINDEYVVELTKEDVINAIRGSKQMDREASSKYRE